LINFTYSSVFNPEFLRRLRGQRPRTGLRWHFFLLYLMLGTHVWLHEFDASNAS